MLKLSCSRLTSVRVLSVVMRVSLPPVRPIVLPAALPMVPRLSAFGSRTLDMLPVPIVRPIREVDLSSEERRLVAACFFSTDIDGSLLPITLTIPRPRSVRSVERSLFTTSGVDGLIELTAGCFTPVGAEEFRVPIVPPIREVLLERAAGCSAPLGTDGLVVLISLPIREVMLGLIRLLVLVVDRFVITLLELLKLELLLLELLLFVIAPLELLLLGVRFVIIFRVVLLGVRLVITLLEMLLLGA
jgi:hypothetical protein